MTVPLVHGVSTESSNDSLFLVVVALEGLLFASWLLLMAKMLLADRVFPWLPRRALLAGPIALAWFIGSRSGGELIEPLLVFTTVAAAAVPWRRFRPEGLLSRTVRSVPSVMLVVVLTVVWIGGFVIPAAASDHRDHGETAELARQVMETDVYCDIFACGVVLGLKIVDIDDTNVRRCGTRLRAGRTGVALFRVYTAFAWSFKTISATYCLR